MGGSATGPRSFIDSAERRGKQDLERMREVFSRDPTPALKERIERTERAHAGRMRALRRAHERFERTMAPSDDELRVRGSSERSEPLLGDPALVEKIAKRKMGEAEYDDLINGPDIRK